MKVISVKPLHRLQLYYKRLHHKFFAEKNILQKKTYDVAVL